MYCRFASRANAAASKPCGKVLRATPNAIGSAAERRRAAGPDSSPDEGMRQLGPECGDAPAAAQAGAGGGAGVLQGPFEPLTAAQEHPQHDDAGEDDQARAAEACQNPPTDPGATSMRPGPDRPRRRQSGPASATCPTARASELPRARPWAPSPKRARRAAPVARTVAGGVACGRCGGRGSLLRRRDVALRAEVATAAQTPGVGATVQSRGSVRQGRPKSGWSDSSLRSSLRVNRNMAANRSQCKDRFHG